MFLSFRNKSDFWRHKNLSVWKYDMNNLSFFVTSDWVSVLSKTSRVSRRIYLCSIRSKCKASTFQRHLIIRFSTYHQSYYPDSQNMKKKLYQVFQCFETVFDVTLNSINLWFARKGIKKSSYCASRLKYLIDLKTNSPVLLVLFSLQKHRWLNTWRYVYVCRTVSIL